MARHYIFNLGEETRKGMLEKARSGVYPSFAPVGYRNADDPEGKRIIVPDPQTADKVKEPFQPVCNGILLLELTRSATLGRRPHSPGLQVSQKDDRAESKTRKVQHDFAYKGLVGCGPLWMPSGGENQEGSLCVLPLHREAGEAPRGVHLPKLPAGKPRPNVARNLLHQKSTLLWLPGRNDHPGV